MLFILVLIITPFVLTDTRETTLPVSIIFDGITLKSWNEQSMWNNTRTRIVYHLNLFCKPNNHCDAQYGINNIHLLNVSQYGLSSIYLNITADQPIFNKIVHTKQYNYTALLTSALFQTKIDIEHLHDNQLLNTTVSSSTISSNQNSVVKRTSRLLFVLLGIILFIIVFALTIFLIQKIQKHKYSKLLKISQTQDELLTQSPSTLPLNS